MKPVAYEVRNGVVGFQIWYEKEWADRVAAEQQKKHDLSGSLAAFHVVPLYEQCDQKVGAGDTAVQGDMLLPANAQDQADAA